MTSETAENTTPELRLACQLIAQSDRPLALLDRTCALVSANAEFRRVFEGMDDLTDIVETPAALSAWMAQPVVRRPLQLDLMANGEALPFQLSYLDAASPDTFLLMPQVNDPASLGQRRMLDRLDLGFWDLDVRTNAFRATETWRRIRGLPHDAVIDVSSKRWTDAIHPDDRDKIEALYDAQIVGDVSVVNVQYRHAHPSREWVWVLCRASILDRDRTGRPTRIIGIDTEISDLKEQEADSINLAEKLQLAVEASGLGVFEFDPTTLTVNWDDRMLEIYGLDDGMNLRPRQDWDSFLHPEDRDTVLALSEECDRLGLDLASDFRIVRPDGDIRYIRAQSRRVHSPAMGERLIGVNIDITEDMRRTKELEDARNLLRHESLHDPLTGLGNRRCLDQTMADFTAQLGAHAGYVILAIDLDYFKTLNDRYGHAAGDAGLLKVTRRIEDTIPVDAKAFRVGGDEFMVLIRSDLSDAAMDHLCRRLVAILSKPFDHDGIACKLGASIGYARGRGRTEDASRVFVEADTALYEAKHAGRMCYRAFEDVKTSATPRRSISDREFSEALERGEITCVLQPQFDAHTRAVIGAEALVRWTCRNRGLVSPGDFLTQAAKAGCLADIDRSIFLQVISLQTEWHERALSFPPISINVSKDRLFDPTFCSDLSRYVRPHHALSFELLETAFYDQIPTALEFPIDAIREAGIPLEIDDFGSGHASILAVQTLQPDRIKFDQALVARAVQDTRGRKVLQALIQIARLQSAEVLLEGIETEAMLAAAATFDCDALQGYQLSRPLSVDAFEALLCSTYDATA